MYEEFFGLRERPFTATARADRYFPAESIEAARIAVSRSIERAEGCGVVIGPPGTGKTLLLHVLAEQFRGPFTPVLLTSMRLDTQKALLQAILFELGHRFRRMEEGELRLALIDQLAPNEESPGGMLLLIDEAHTMSPKLFEELRMLTNVIRDGTPRVRLVLSGAAKLEERFAHPKLASFSQRISARGFLEAFNGVETEEFIRAQLAGVGGDPDAIFAKDALRAVYESTDGVPRLINQVCDHALLLAAAGGVKNIDAAGIEESWADLQQLPMPWQQQDSHDPSSLETAEDEQAVVEFGMLEDDGVEPDTTNDADPLAGFAGYSASNDEQPPEENFTTNSDSAGEEEFEPIGSIGPDADEHDDDASVFNLVEDGEVVIDHFVGLEAGNVLQTAPAPPSPVMDREPAGEEIFQDDQQVGGSADFQEMAVPQTAAHVEEDDFDPASDPVLPEEETVAEVTPEVTPTAPAEPTAPTATVVQAAPSVKQFQPEPPPQAVIEPKKPSAPRNVQAAVPRQGGLFATLRDKKNQQGKK